MPCFNLQPGKLIVQKNNSADTVIANCGGITGGK